MAGADIIVRAGDNEFGAYMASPRSDRAPAVMVLQEIFGLTPSIRAACDWLAAKGYIAIAPDLFWRQQPGVVLSEADRDRAMQLFKNLNEELAIQDCASTLNYARSLPKCNGKAAALGYCLGGKLAYLMAAQTDIDAAVSYYGVGIQNALDKAALLRAPILVHIAANDALCPAPAQDAIKAALANASSRHMIETYENVGHAFARDGAASYNQDAAARANAKSLSFLAEAFQNKR